MNQIERASDLRIAERSEAGGSDLLEVSELGVY
jgi:hypothetical protein